MYPQLPARPGSRRSKGARPRHSPCRGACRGRVGRARCCYRRSRPTSGSSSAPACSTSAPPARLFRTEFFQAIGGFSSEGIASDYLFWFKAWRARPRPAGTGAICSTTACTTDRSCAAARTRRDQATAAAGPGRCSDRRSARSRRRTSNRRVAISSTSRRATLTGWRGSVSCGPPRP